MISRLVFVPAALIAVAVALSGCSAVLTATQGTMENQRTAASDAAAKAEILNAKLAIVTALVDTGTLPTSIAALADYGYTPTAGVTGLSFGGSGATFCVSGTSIAGTTYHATDTESVSEGSCP